MNEAALPPSVDLAEDIELMFDDAGAEPPAPEPKAARPRKGRALKKGHAVPPPPSAAEAEALLAEYATSVTPAGVPEDAPPAPPEPEPVAETTAAPIAAPAPARPHPLLIATVVLALFTSCLSLGGLIAVGRTLAAAQADRAAAADSRRTLDRIPALVETLAAQSARLDAAAAKIAAATPGGPAVTIGDVRHELDTLKLALAGQRPQGVDQLDSKMHDGFAALAARIDRLGDHAPAVSASRPATRADDRARSF